MNFLDAFTILLETPKSLTVLTAPPAWGKTSLLRKIIFQKRKKIVFISPLKALALELYFSMSKSYGNKVQFIINKKSALSSLESFSSLDYGLLIATPEVLEEVHIDYLKNSSGEIIYVFDEFHLFYFWGQSFRPKMFEILMCCAVKELNILGLTATLSNSLNLLVKSNFLMNLENIFIINFGNMKLLYPPKKNIGLRSHVRNTFKRRLNYEISKHNKLETYLVFCKFRGQVDTYKKLLEKKGFTVLGCKGGEVDFFISSLDLHNPPDIIISTSCLGHGVNLPSITKIFIDHELSEEMLIQMIGRGGRKGEEYNAYHLNTFISIKGLLLDFVLRVWSAVCSI